MSHFILYLDSEFGSEQPLSAAFYGVLQPLTILFETRRKTPGKMVLLS